MKRKIVTNSEQISEGSFFVVDEIGLHWTGSNSKHIKTFGSKHTKETVEKVLERKIINKR